MTDAMVRAVPPAAARGNGRYGIVDLTPPLPPPVPPAGEAGVQINGTREGHEKAAAMAGRTPVPLWKARDILLEAVSGKGAGFFETHSALLSKKRRRGSGGDLLVCRGNDVSISGGAGNGCHNDMGGGAGGGEAGGGDVERVFSVRLEVGVRCGAGPEGRERLRFYLHSLHSCAMIPSTASV